MSIMPKWMNWLPPQWYASTLLLPILILAYPSLRFGEASTLDASLGTVNRMDENTQGQGPKDTMLDSGY